MANRSDKEQFEAHLAEVVDKTATRELLDLIANDDEMRDARHEVERVVRLIACAADDLSPMPLEQPTRSPAIALSQGDVAGLTATAVIESETRPQVVAAKDESATPQTAVADAVSKPKDTAKSSGATSSQQLVPSPTSNRRFRAAGVVMLLALVGIVVALWWGTSSKRSVATAVVHSLHGKLAKLEVPSEASHVELCEGERGPCRAAAAGMEVGPGMLLRTNATARAKLILDSGDSIALDRATAVVLTTDGSSSLTLNTGTIVVAMESVESPKLAIALAAGRAELERAKCAIMVASGQTVVEVTRGRVKLFDRDDHVQTIGEGEAGRLKSGRDIDVTMSRTGGDLVAATEFDSGEIEAIDQQRGLGELHAKKPGELLERNNAVRLSKHDVNIHIVGPIARTQIDETFTNDTNDVLEGIFRFPLPADAQIERLALETDGRLVEGAFADRERASAIWRGSIVHAAPQMRAQIHDEIVWVPGPWRDPALLEWQRGNRFELRIYPIPSHGSRRIVIAYTEVVPGSAGVRHYSYPLPRHGADSRGVDAFSLRVELRGHDPAHPPLVKGYEGRLSKASADVASFAVDERQFAPHGDLVVDYALPPSQQDLVGWAHQPAASGEGPYVAWLLRPKLPRQSEQAPQAYAFIVDTSRSMVGESLRRASALTVRMIQELPSDCRVSLLACDSECRLWPGGVTGGGAVASASAERWLRTQTAEGASDLTAAIAAAQEALRGTDSHRQLVYVGDGTPTAGPTRPATITREVQRLIGSTSANVTAIAVGTDSDLESLRAVARGGRGVVVPYVPGTSVARASYAALAATFGSRLLDAHIELPPGVSSVAPGHLDTIAAGDELLIVGRLEGAAVRGDLLLRGRVEGRAFEQRYAIDLRSAAGEANAFVPRLYAAARLADLERRGDSAAKSEAIELSRRFNVASRYTSLLVLESQAMFDAFGLDNRRKSEVWTGELEASAVGSAAEAGSEDEQPPAAELAASPARMAAEPASPGKSELRKAAAAPAMAKSPIDRISDFDKKEAAGASNRAASAPVPAPATPLANAAPASAGALSARGVPLVAIDEGWERDRLSKRRMVPMRRVWERKGDVAVGRTTPSSATGDRVQAAERELSQYPDRRSATKQLFDLYAKSGELGKAAGLAEQWSQRDPLDVEALVARADLAARRGDRSLAIRILGSVVDVRPSDVGAQQRLSRLYRWQGQPERACRFSIALAEFRPNDEKTLAEALRCLGDPSSVELSRELKASVTEQVLRAAEFLTAKPRGIDVLSGDLRVNATWQGVDGLDLDLSLIDPDGHRVSWLGAPTHAVISAVNATSQHEEGLALRGGKPGEYLLELSRGSGSGNARGSVVVQVAGAQREIPFTMDGERLALAVVTIKTVPRLVPLTNPTQWIAK